MDAQKLTDAKIELIANDGMRNAAGGIYSTRVHEFARGIEAAVRDALQAELASMTRMFHAACADLGAINEALGLDPDDGGAEPIIGAIEELKAQIAALAHSDAVQAPEAWSVQWPGDPKETWHSVFLNERDALQCASHHDGSTVTPLYAAPVAPAAAPIPLLAADHKGMRVDYSGVFKQATTALARGLKEPGLAEMLRQLQEHITELGQRWYAGDTAVVDELLQLYCVEKDARDALVAASGAAQ